VKAQKIRCQNDLELFEKLAQNPLIQQANNALTRHQADHPSSLRRRLLSTSVRLSSWMAPDIHKIADACTEILEINIPLELYVFPSGQFNAVCFKPEDERLFIMFSSSLLEGFSDAELLFVLGHELGHHLYSHHDIPVAYLMKGKQQVDPELALEIFSWSRYAEISADRAGAHCAPDLDSVARSLFKLASGLSGKTIRFSLDDFLAQVDDMVADDAQPGVGTTREDWFSTHPFSPLRVKALKLFDQSEYERQGGMEKSDLEIAVQSLMSLMEPSYIEGKTEAATHMRRLLYAGAIAIAAASDGITDEEITLFEKFFGTGEFSTGLDVDRLIEDLPNRIEKVREHSSILQRMQVLRDLCLMARASGEVTAAEKDVLRDIARQTGVLFSFIQQTLSQQISPD